MTPLRQQAWRAVRCNLAARHGVDIRTTDSVLAFASDAGAHDVAGVYLDDLLASSSAALGALVFTAAGDAR